MKGTFFLKPLEFNVTIFAEKFEQGALIKGQVAVTNHDKTSSSASRLGVTLALGDSRKIKKKDVKAFIPFASESFSKEKWNGEQLSLDFSFQLEDNCLISSKSSSFYLLCGDQKDLLSAGALELNITPNRWFQ